jgi:hypothetical protein
MSGSRSSSASSIDAHIDTIGLLVGCDDATARAAHLDYLQGLVRQSKQLIARRERSRAA